MKSLRLIIGLILLAAASLAQAAELDARVIAAKESFDGLSIGQQTRILRNLEKSHMYGRVMRTFWVPRADLEPARLVSGMFSLLYSMNRKGSESNCYWTSMYATGALGLPEKYMGLEEYDALLAKNFRKLARDTPFEPGDVVRLKRARGGMETHSVVYLGELKGNAYTRLVLSKNGPVDSPYLIMELSDLMNRFYPGSIVSAIYRR